MNRRNFLALASGLMVPSRSYFFAPATGWREPTWFLDKRTGYVITQIAIAMKLPRHMIAGIPGNPLAVSVMMPYAIENISVVGSLEI